jgi:hypothetical protein
MGRSDDERERRLAMVEWQRSTPWRQGSILNRRMLSSCDRTSADLPEGIDVAIVVSHDCDIAADPGVEPGIEVIPINFVTKENGSLTHAKNPRRLHLNLTRRSTGEQYFGEFKATDKYQIPKEQFAGLLPSEEYMLAPEELEILRRWLAARYRRHAFSDEFEKRFKKVEQKLREILMPSSNHLRAILFYVDEDLGTGLAEDSAPYPVDMLLIYTSDDASEESLKVAEAAKAKIEKTFQNKYRHAGEWHEIELRSCDVISDNAITYKQYLQFAEWRCEDLSLRSGPVGPMTEENS